ncbi:MAG: HprK-related kinase A [Chromatiaceae bacterium]|nr:HprK-related kinase A [Chromatiaceae bacterium]
MPAIIPNSRQDEIRRALRGDGYRIKIGPFNVSLRSRLNKVAESMSLFYGDYPQLPADAFVDYHVRVDNPLGLRRWLHPQAIFSFDGFTPFKPLPEAQAFAMFEWGLNWCIATTAHQFLVVHSAVVAKDDRAIILPGDPGSGKSTLCAAMVSQGWRLLSDEMALIDPEAEHITPLPRPIGLKNESIEIIRTYGNNVTLGPSINDTAKGTVAHMRPPPDTLQHATRAAQPDHIVFPRYTTGAATELRPLNKPRTLTRVAEQSFNYHILGEDGFTTLTRLVSNCPAVELSYSHLDSAIAQIDALVS